VAVGSVTVGASLSAVFRYIPLMRIFLVLPLAVCLLVPGFSAVAGEASAVHKATPHDMRDDALDSLFAKLQQASNADDAKQTEQKIWDMWAQSDSVTADVLLNQAVAAMDAGDNKSSLAILDQVIASYPAYAEAWNKRATLNFMIGRYDESLADINKVLDLEPRHFGALSGRGMIYEAQQKWGDALEAFREALKINPNMTAVKNAIHDLEQHERAL
jgi:tetratricopeptide (TPR) repeat protein